MSGEPTGATIDLRATQSEYLNGRLIKIDTVCAIVGVSRATVYRLIKSDEFPGPVKIGAASLWVEREVIGWVDERIKAREKAS